MNGVLSMWQLFNIFKFIIQMLAFALFTAYSFEAWNKYTIILYQF